MRIWLLGAAVLVTFTAGCAREAPAAPAPSPSSASTGAAATVRTDPVALIGLWKLSGAEVPKDAVLRIGTDDDITLFRPCAALMGNWRADTAGLFLSSFDSYSPGPGKPSCEPSGPRVQPAWMTRIAGYRVDGTAPLLLDAAGATVVRLLPGAAPVVRDDMVPELSGKPVVTDETRQRLGAVAAALPAGLVPATRAQLLGRWLPADRTAGAFAELRADGQWQGSDGCNGLSGGWTSGPDGSLLAVSGPTTLIGCASAPIGSWLTAARRAGLAGDALVLLDATGKELGRLIR
ncbi:META domain-containing protein [Actinoplanes sp. L3-i22]|uniref:META domain-containing protein n=1 Tax=Actinoplanes sp. L3-i22 TaxID=2836373 RepID=UPI001C84B2A6|nr:META domain-containing protein [Actinoplanes sp. L3-i22]